MLKGGREGGWKGDMFVELRELEGLGGPVVPGLLVKSEGS